MDLQTICGPLPGGADLAGYDGYRGNLRITVEGLLSFADGDIRWAIRVEKPTVTNTGKAGKPKQVLLLTDVTGTPPQVLLRQLANLWEQNTPMVDFI